MVDFANAMEYAVCREAQAQLEAGRLDGTLRLAEVAAWALNRLPALYVTSGEGYRHHMDRALNGLATEVTEAVRRSVQALQNGDPLRDGTVFDRARFATPRGMIPQLRRLFERESLSWRDLPKAVGFAAGKKAPPPLPQPVEPSPERAYSWRVGAEVRMYLARAKRKDAGATRPTAAAKVELAPEHLDLYVLQPQWGWINLMEEAVTTAVEQIIAEEFPLEGCPNPAEAIAYALNRLPSLYATSIRGEAYSRQRATQTLARDIRIQARSGVVRVRCYPKRAVTSIPFAVVAEECTAAMAELQGILGRDDLTLGNLIPAIKEACPPIREKFHKADLKEQGEQAWQRGDIPARSPPTVSSKNSIPATRTCVCAWGCCGWKRGNGCRPKRRFRRRSNWAATTCGCGLAAPRFGSSSAIIPKRAGCTRTCWAGIPKT
ncbi:MAG: late competence development ComFB family protein [Oscillatoriales cyanobacterium SM2_1_8]|nr:late competence development ComFB family protein [Oscillatoriales cyanobacterium SM2_1_8]